MSRRTPGARDPFMYGLMSVLAVLAILLLLTMWLMPLLYPTDCEPVFPEFQLPTLGGVE